MGAGSAGLGVANILLQYKVKLGLTEPQAYDDIYLFSQKGLVTKDRENLNKLLVPFAKDSSNFVTNNIVSIIQQEKPGILIGLTAQHGVFTKEIIQTMTESCEQIRPIIFPLSNPTSNAEATF